MIQKFAAALLTFLYFSTVLASDAKNIGVSGFKEIEATKRMMKLQFQDEKSFMISSERFSSEAQARSFCKENGLSLDSDGFSKILLLAMSEAASVDDKIEAAISFKLDEENTGIATWAGSDNQVVIMWDGRGSSTETVKADDLAGATFTAVCE